MLNLYDGIVHCTAMNAITEVIDAIENRVSKLLHKMELLKQENLKLARALETSEASRSIQEKTILDWKEKYKALKLANSMLGSNKNKAEAKLKIDTLIREIDQCIAQLSEEP